LNPARWPQNRFASILLTLGSGCLSGLLYGWSIPRADIYWLAWICLVPCLLIVPFASRSMVVAAGLSGGLVAGIGRIYWITETLQLYGNLPFLIGLFTNALLIFYLALYPVFFFYICSKLRFNSPLFAWITASLWVLLEWAQTWIITGFPWELLGYSQYLNRPLLQLASVTGVYGLSFLIVLVNAALAQILVFRANILRLGLPPILLLLCALGFGYYRLNALSKESTSPIQVGIVQGNFRQEEKWDPTRLERTIQRYVELTRSLSASRQLDLIIYPETALPMYFQDPHFAAQSQRITDLAREIATPILVGSLKGGSGSGKPPYNRAFLLDGQGEVRDFADKVHLVPFGEYLPLPFLFQYLEGLTAESGAFAHGEAHKALNLPNTDLRFGVFLCYESIFPEITRTLAGLGASFLINTTNDAWFGQSAAPYQHFSMVVVRAVETGLPILRAANTGISGLISPSGEILKATQLFETVTFVVSMTPRITTTLYVQYGDVLLLLCALFLAGIALRHRLTTAAGTTQ
jgi:apolipoprotein N-acyltransferase